MFGLRLRKPNGKIVFSTEMSTWNLVDILYYPQNGNVSKTYPGIRHFETLVSMVFVNPTPMNHRAYKPITTFEGDTFHALAVNAPPFVYQYPNRKATVTIPCSTDAAYIYIFAR